MALLSTGNWYEVSFSNTNGAAWGLLATPPSIPPTLIDNIVNGTTFVIYVTDAATGTFAFRGGTATGYDDSLMSAAPVGPLTANTWTTDDAIATPYTIDSSSEVYTYDAAAGTLRRYPAAGANGTAAMKAFLP